MSIYVAPPPWQLPLWSVFAAFLSSSCFGVSCVCFLICSTFVSDLFCRFVGLLLLFSFCDWNIPVFAAFGCLQRVFSFAVHLPLSATVWLSLKGRGKGDQPSGVAGKQPAAVGKPDVTVEAALWTEPTDWCCHQVAFLTFAPNWRIIYTLSLSGKWCESVCVSDLRWSGRQRPPSKSEQLKIQKKCRRTERVEQFKLTLDWTLDF